MKRLAAVVMTLGLTMGPAGISCSSEAFAASAWSSCCKVCKKGKACGDSCIAADKTCNKGKGCACNG